MRKINSMFTIFLLIMLVGCNNVESSVSEKSKKDNVLYFGKGTTWFGSYTITKVNTSYFESLYIQHITDRTSPLQEQSANDDIGKIEYILDMGDTKLESSYPRSLKGIGNFHTATETNEDFIDEDFPEQITLTINWNDETEVISLKNKINNNGFLVVLP